VSHGPSLIERDSRDGLGKTAPPGDAGPLGSLPRLSHRQVSLERRLERWACNGSLPARLGWLQNEMGIPVAIDRPEILWRASGLGRAGLVAQMTVSRLATRLAMGIEISLAHAVVDRLLGFDRTFAQSRLQLTPVEWGVCTFLFVRAIRSFAPEGGPDSRPSPDIAGDLSPGELTLDRVGPDPFDPTGLGSIVTVRWPVRIGNVAGAVRLWLPEMVVNHWAAGPTRPAGGDTVAPPCRDHSDRAGKTIGRVPRSELASCWRAEAGLVTMSQGLKRLRVGGVLPLSNSALTGTPASLTGPVALILDLEGQDALFRIPVSPVADSGGRLMRIEASPLLEPRLRRPNDATISETRPMSQPIASSATPPAAGPLDVPVTLTVELGRVNLTLTQLADLKPGDVVELNRNSRAPVELTSNGRLVARGELILIDTDLGVRVTNVFL
jgi:flagellar motor switch protein FliN